MILIINMVQFIDVKITGLDCNKSTDAVGAGMCFSYIISMTKNPTSSIRARVPLVVRDRVRPRPAAAARPRNVLEEISMKSFRIEDGLSVWGAISALRRGSTSFPRIGARHINING